MREIARVTADGYGSNRSFRRLVVALECSVGYQSTREKHAINWAFRVSYWRFEPMFSIECVPVILEKAHSSGVMHGEVRLPFLGNCFLRCCIVHTRVHNLAMSP